MSDTHTGLINALRNGQQCDEDGVMCVVSRQACHEAADLLASQPEDPRIGELKAQVENINFDYGTLSQAFDEATEENTTLAAQVKELRDAAESVIAYDRHGRLIAAKDGDGDRLENVIFAGEVEELDRLYDVMLATTQKALASTEHPSSDAVRQIERGALERAAKACQKKSDDEHQAYLNLLDKGYGTPARIANTNSRAWGEAAKLVRALAEGGE